MKDLFTIGQIADQLREPPARVGYVIGKHRMKAVDRVGIIRRFDQQQVELIKSYLYGIRIQANRL